MSIRFVENLDEEPTHGWYNVGTKIIFATIKTATGIDIAPSEIIDIVTGEHVSLGVPIPA